MSAAALLFPGADVPAAPPPPGPLRYRLRTVTIDVVREGPARLPAVQSSVQMAEIARAILSTLDAHIEHLGIIALDAGSRPRRFKIVSTGTQTSSLVHPREVFTAAMGLSANTIVLFHNHPSGDPDPSHPDRDITRRLQSCGTLLGIEVQDHLVIGADGAYVSFLDRGWL